MVERQIPYFGGPVASVLPSLIDLFQASTAYNATTADGGLKPRLGFKNLRAAQASFAAGYGLSYCQGYNSSNAEVEEYLSFENLGAGTAAYSRHVTTLAPTAITGGGSLNASDWMVAVSGANAYAINPANTTNVYRHIIGDATSWVALAIPPDPTAALTYRVDLASGGSSQYATMSWAGTDAADVTVTGGTRTTSIAVDTGGTLSIRHENDVQESSFEVDLSAITAGNQDWQYNDAFYFTLTPANPSLFDIDPASVRVTLTNADGSPKSMIPTKVDTFETNQATSTYGVRLQFDNKTRADWDNIKKFKVAYRWTKASETQANNVLRVSPVTVGCCILFPASQSQYVVAKFGYSYVVNTTSLESGVTGEVNITRDTGAGISPDPTGHLAPLGAWITFTMTVSPTAAVDFNRLYWNDARPTDLFSTRRWKRIVTQTDATLTYTLKMSYDELVALTEYAPGPFKTTNCVNAFSYRESMVWLYAEGISNVRYSKINYPEIQATAIDQEDDDTRGATFTLADNFADSPLVGCQAGESAIIGGSNGIYEQIGDRPSNMSPPKRMPGGLGVANKLAFCRWKDDFGNAGAVFVDRHGTGVWFALPSGSGNRDAEGRIIELTSLVRGELRRWLMLEQADLGITDFSTVKVFVDESQDALFVVMGKRAMKLPPINPVSQKREWEFTYWNLGSSAATVKYVAPSAKRRIRWMRSTGLIDENEVDQTTGLVIEGLQRDGGSAMPQGLWTSKLMDGPNRRISQLYVERDRPYDPVSVRVDSERLNQIYKIGGDKRFMPCSIKQQGRRHQVSVIVTEDMSRVTRLMWQETKLGERLHR